MRKTMTLTSKDLRERSDINDVVQALCERAISVQLVFEQKDVDWAKEEIAGWYKDGVNFSERVFR